MAELPTARTLVAVSGGPDSTALLLALHEAGRDIVAAHYDHALREGSDQVASDVAAMCARIGVPMIAERRTEPLPKGSLQAAARTLRYAFLDRARAESRADVIATAHTADDLVEGAALHMLRGCGIAGFRGMPARRGHYVRPFLSVWRRDVRQFLEQRGVVAYEDPANVDTRFARVRARLLILPSLERDRPGILRRLHAAALAASTWHDVAAREAAQILAAGPLTGTRLRAFTEATASAALQLLYVRAGGPEPGLSRAHIEAMRRLARPGPGGRGVDLPGGLRFRIVGDLMQVVPSRLRPHEAARLDVRACAGCADGYAAHLRPGLHLRLGFRRPGLRMRPVGGRGTRKVQDIFVDARVPREERDEWPLVFAGERLAWIPGIAIEADLARRPDESGLHVTVTPMPVASAGKIARLETPKALEEI
jgi:tRNA(Ile)-lysidine synthetase-like protein